MRSFLYAVSLVLISATSFAQETVPLTSISERAHLKVNAGGMFLSHGDDWSGASVGAVAGYNLHPKMSVAAGYDHGFAVRDGDGGIDVVRGWANFGITPSVYAGFGYARYAESLEGGFAQLVLYRPIMSRFDLSLVYAHVFPRGEADDFEQVRAVFSYHLLGKE